MRSWTPLQACTGPAPWPATSASGDQVTGELLHLVRIALQAFELLALPAGPLRRPPAPPRRRAGFGGPWALPLAGARCGGPLAGLHGAGAVAGHQRQRLPGGA